MSECFIYIIAHEIDGCLVAPVKVGITKSLSSRLSSIQTGNWQKVSIAYQFGMASRELAVLIEAAFHEDAKEHRLTGEWFSMDPLWALESLCGVVIDVVGRVYGEDNKVAALGECGAIGHLETVATNFWGVQ